MYKRLLDTHSDGNGLYNLFKIPMHVRWSNANSVLEPTEGATINFRAIPTLHFPKHPFAYCINTLTTSFYKSLTTDNSYVFASKMLLGSIWGSSRRMIPASERFYEGTENTLRGYRFMTVSPLHHHKPIGGRSMLIFSEELRVKATETLGWALFYDLGNVYSNAFPELNQKWLQSVGWGLRYHTPVGPLRLDFAVPLNRRRHLDYRFQIYLSIGQAF
jgi:translocation and assembly module TamA